MSRFVCHCAHVEVRGQFVEIILSYGSWGLNSGCQFGWQMPLPMVEVSFFYQLDTHWSHLGRRNLNRENVSIRLACR